MTEKGQASIGALLILSAVLMSVTYLQVKGKDTFETNNEINSARNGVQNAVTRLSIQNGIKIDILDWQVENENIVYYLKVQGGPPPENLTITSNAENIAKSYIEGMSTKYNIVVKIKDRVKK